MTNRRSTDDDDGDGRSGPRPSGIVCLWEGFFFSKKIVLYQNSILEEDWF